jgi:hypothetical protein
MMALVRRAIQHTVDVIREEGDITVDDVVL